MDIDKMRNSKMGNQMFSNSQGATSTYRTLARGAGCDWSRTYRELQERHAPQRDGACAARGTRSGTTARTRNPNAATSGTSSPRMRTSA